jgi:hypothetical protein
MSKNMSKIEDFLAELRRHNIELWLEGADLRYRAPKDAFTPDLMSNFSNKSNRLKVPQALI